MDIIEENTKQMCFCTICGNSHEMNECALIKIINYIPDTYIPSKAILTLPHFLKLQKLIDNSYKLITNEKIEKGTKFGPVQAKVTNFLDPSIAFPLKIFQDNQEFYLDTTDENECNWMMFISFASSYEEQNLICYQDKDNIFYVTTKTIEAGQSLNVWYSPYYAQKMNCDILKPKLMRKIDSKFKINLDGLVRMQQKIIDKKVWTCKFCGEHLESVPTFAKHLINHYNSQKGNHCEICRSTFRSKKNLKAHLYIVHSQPNKMTKTNQKNAAGKLLNNTNEIGGPLLNEIFSDSVDNSINLNQLNMNNIDNRLLDADYDNEELNENFGQFNFEIDNDNDERPYVCDICLKQFKTCSSLRVHLKFHAGDFTCTKCLTVYSRSESLKNHSCNNIQKFICTLCNSSFAQRKYLNRHKKIHNGTFKCSFCKHDYSSKRELTIHNCSAINDTEKKKSICPICSKYVLNERYLKKHMQVHLSAEERKVLATKCICEICGVQLETKNSYYLHKRCHSKPSFACNSCTKVFTRKDSLKMHLQTHQNNITQVECKFCKKKLKSYKTLRMHINAIHSATNALFKCSLCQLKFKLRSSLTSHLKKKHTNKEDSINNNDNNNENQNPDYYNCPICQKGIKLRSSLLRHLKTKHQKTNSDLNNINDILPIINEKQDENDINVDCNNKKTDLLNLKEQNVENLADCQCFNVDSTEENREICLSIPDLNGTDQEITLDQNAYILDNGTIVQPQGNSDNVIMYVLDQNLTLNSINYK